MDRHRADVDEKDDVGFETLGTVHRHHPHLVADGIGVATDLGLGRVEPGEEALQRRGVRLLVGERLGKELVEHVLGLGPEPPQELAAAMMPIGEDLAVEGIGVVIVGPRPPVVELAARRGERTVRIADRRLAECPPQGLLAAPVGDRKELVVVEADQRTLQQGGQRQVVLGEKHDPAERHQVHDGDMLGEDQPVGAGDGDPARLQGAVDGVGLGAARAGEDQDVAGTDGLPRRLQHFGALQPAIDGVGDAIGELHLGALIAEMIDRAGPVLRVGLLRRLDHRPDDHLAPAC